MQDTDHFALAILNPRGANYNGWLEILGSTRVPLIDANGIQMRAGKDGALIDVYLINIRALTLGQRARLLMAIAQRTESTIYAVEATINECGCPINAADVTLYKPAEV